MDPAFAMEVEMLSKMRVVDEAIKRGDSEVQQFYKDATVLVSGGTGFMGKQMIEKLFRSCDIKKVFLLIRPKKNKTIAERMSVILADAVFDTVKKAKPGFEKRICPIDADMAKPRLGIGEQDRSSIIAETDIIIHVAATVNFNEPLRVAVNTNVRGTVEMLNIAKQCLKLKSFVHISTAFSHATESRIGKDLLEMFYDAPVSPQAMLEMVETLDEQNINDMTPELIKGWPNTYTFTKAIAEEACRQASADLPISIVRPAVLISSLLEPGPGWLDMSNILGPSGIIFGIGLGLLHTFICDMDKRLDIVPVDLVNNAIIAIAWLTAKQRSEGNLKPKIYNVTNIRNVITNGEALSHSTELRSKIPSLDSPYAILFYPTSNKLLYFILSWLWHYIPAYVVDVVRRLMGKNPMAVRLYTKMDTHCKVLSYFMTNAWRMSDANLQHLFSSLNTTDKQIFNCDVSTILWADLIFAWGLGCRRYILKDGLQGTEKAVRKQFWLTVFHYAVICPLYIYLLYKMAALGFFIFYYVFSCVKSIF